MRRTRRQTLTPPVKVSKTMRTPLGSGTCDNAIVMYYLFRLQLRSIGKLLTVEETETQLNTLPRQAVNILQI
jgi:hypothetical protein